MSETQVGKKSTLTMNERAVTIPNAATDGVKQHWPEYFMEAWGLGLFMVSACSFGVLLEHPASPVHQAIPDAFARRVLMGTAMGLTAIGNVFSPWGKRSGAHTNPSVTLTFARLGKIQPVDAVFYTIAQFIGGVTGIFVAASLLTSFISHQRVNYVATVPGNQGAGVAFAAEVVISFILMSVVLRVSNSQKLSRFTGLFAGVLVATFISFEAPFSGMSMNPARSFGSALPSQAWSAVWIYFTAPPLGMLLAAELYLRLRGSNRVFCAKLHHHNDNRCIFRCNFAELLEETASVSPKTNLS